MWLRWSVRYCIRLKGSGSGQNVNEIQIVSGCHTYTQGSQSIPSLGMHSTSQYTEEWRGLRYRMRHFTLKGRIKSIPKAENIPICTELDTYSVDVHFPIELHVLHGFHTFQVISSVVDLRVPWRPISKEPQPVEAPCFPLSTKSVSILWRFTKNFKGSLYSYEEQIISLKMNRGFP